MPIMSAIFLVCKAHYSSIIHRTQAEKFRLNYSVGTETVTAVLFKLLFERNYFE
jgi:hypothetical protein